jgi:magnesium transporter
MPAGERGFLAQGTIPPDLRRLLRERRWQELAAEQGAWPEVSLAAPEVTELLLDLDPKERVLLFRALPGELAAAVFARLRPATRDRLVLELTDSETARLLADLQPDDRTSLLGELPGQVTQRLLNLVPSEERAVTLELLGYPEDSVGRLMTPYYLAVRPAWTIERALEHVRERGREDEMSNMVFVVDGEWRLLDDLPLQRLVLAAPDRLVRDVMDEQHVRLDPNTDREEAVLMMRRYDRVALPVVDASGVLIGAVTVDDVMGVAEEEATEDFYRSSAITPAREGYWESTIAWLYRRRIGWLVGLVLVNLVSSGVIAAYEEMLMSYVALAFFIPLLIDTGGNAGSQSATIMIRAISLGEVRANQWWRAFLKEAALGLMIGVTLGLLGLVLGLFRGGFAIGLIVMITMILMLLLTNLLGVLLPFVLMRFGRDPAVASGPLITSVADAIGLLVYFWVAALVLGL